MTSGTRRRVAVVASVAAMLGLLAAGWLLSNPVLLILSALAAAVAMAVLDRRSGWRGWLVVAVLVLLAASTAYGQMDGLLKGMHEFGKASYGLSSLGVRSDKRVAAVDAINGWKAWDCAVNGRGGPQCAPPVEGVYASPRHVARLTIAVDTLLLIPAYLLALLLLVRRARGQLSWVQDDPQGDPSTPASGSRAARRRAYRAIAMIGQVALGVAVAADLVENLAYWKAIGAYWSPGPAPVGGWTALLIRWTWLFTLFKFIGLAVVGLSLLLLVVTLLESYRPRAGELGRNLKALRAHIVVVVLFGALLILHPQAPDVIRGWNRRQAAIGVSLAVVLAFVVWAFSRRLTSSWGCGRSRARPRFRVLLAFGLGALVIALLLWAIGAPAWGLAVPVGFWVVIALLELLPHDEPPTPLPGPGFGNEALPRLVAASVLVILGIAVLRASIASFVLQGVRSTAGPLIVCDLALVLAAWPLYLVFRLGKLNQQTARSSWRADPFVWVMAFALAIGIFLWVRIVQNVWAVSGLLGTVGVLEAFLIVASIVAGGLVALAELVGPPKFLTLLGFRRFPVFLLLLGWFLVASVLPVAQTFHDVRFISAPDGAEGATSALTSQATPRDVLLRWLRRLPQEAFQKGPQGERRGIPLILVATAGGGIRAAYWTSLVLDCVLRAQPVARVCGAGPGGRDRMAQVLAASGISGGSLGLVTFLAQEVQGTTDPSGGPDWVASRLGGDYLSSSLAWELAVELPRSLLRFDTGMDRAEVIERAWEKSWVSGPWSPGWVHAVWGSGSEESGGPLTEGFFELWEQGGRADGPNVPLLLLNGTSVVDGCRFNTSALDGNGYDPTRPDAGDRTPNCLSSEPAGPGQEPQVLAATRDLADELCGGMRVDVRLSTAAALSARFPFVSPSGRIQDCRQTRQAAYVVDGGYLDSSGALTIEQLWRSLEPLVADYNGRQSLGAGDPDSTCLVPFLIQIDNGYGEPSPDSPTKRPGELAVPATAAFAARSAVTALARQDAATTFSEPDRAAGIVLGERYAHFVTKAHPGTKAPLGWVLSNDAQHDLHVQLSENRDQVRTVARWLTEPQPCG